ncbi:MAG TPA: hypothetical protein PK668_06850 [Myxococcota bacterium]|nr:hypothetical protein [Myxococcota bacterium]HRY92438.1 hypothetical protein [Myxococcota bacterium]HSA22986.1 hypothetical protein [Myxococcota bacterium]
MYYVILGGILVLSTLVLLVAGPRPFLRGPAGANSRPASRVAETPAPRAAVEQKLKALAETPAPPPDQQGAMCYAPMPMHDHAEYVCPLDGSKTQYQFEGGLAELVAGELPALRAQLKQIQDLKPSFELTLDERELCRKCSPKVEKPAIVLVVRYPDARSGKVLEHRTRGVRRVDLQLLHEFQSGSLVHHTGGPDTVPLKDHLPRIRELLGFDPVQPPPPAPKP